MEEKGSMQLPCGPGRVAGLAVLAIAGAIVLSVGACSSHDAKGPPESSQSSAKGGKAEIRGKVASVAGNAVQVSDVSGTVPVEVGTSTKVIENIGAQRTDVVAGSCVRVVFDPQSAPDPAGVVTAKAVQLNLPGDDGKCRAPKTAAEGPPNQPVTGTVVSLEGDTINVAFTNADGNPAATAVTVVDTTRYQKDISATPQAITQDKCIVARGTRNDEGKLQATAVTVATATNGRCS